MPLLTCADFPDGECCRGCRHFVSSRYRLYDVQHTGQERGYVCCGKADAPTFRARCAELGVKLWGVEAMSESGHGCAPLCAACRAELQNRLNPTSDPLGFDVERMLAGEEQVACGRHTPLQQAMAMIREKFRGSGA